MHLNVYHLETPFQQTYAEDNDKTVKWTKIFKDSAEDAPHFLHYKHKVNILCVLLSLWTYTKTT